MERNYKTYNRNFTLLLYPEDEKHLKALEYIEKHYDYEYITHNKDIVQDTGELKKEHIHCVIRVGSNPRWVTAIAKEIGIEMQYIEGCNIEKQLRYLIHFDNPEKYQYNIEECKGNMKNKLVEVINKDKMTETEKIIKIVELIEGEKERVSIKELIKWCCQSGCYDTLRRSQLLITKMLEENNKKF